MKIYFNEQSYNGIVLRLGVSLVQTNDHCSEFFCNCNNSGNSF